jgi:hypothetical protein
MGSFHLFSTTTSWSAQNYDDGRLDAIVTVAMCGFHAKEMVEALRTTGNWKGPIYVITDTPDYYYKNNSDSNEEQSTPMDVRGNHPTFLATQEEFDLYKVGVQERFNPELYSKWHKTQLFHLLPNDKNIQSVLFIDADILAQQPLSKSWLSGVAPTIADPSCELILNPERWYTSFPVIGKGNITLSGKYNSGMMILKRTQSKDVLERWSQLLVRPPFVGRDQGKLTEAIESLGTKICWLPSRWRHVQNQADLIDRLWFRLTGKGTFLHLASAKNKGKRNQEWKARLKQKCNITNLKYHPPTR